jgi:hypothetical protein
MKRSKRNFILMSVLAVVKHEFRKWYGMISIEELVSNWKLTHEVEILERMLAIQGG